MPDDSLKWIVIAIVVSSWTNGCIVTSWMRDQESSGAESDAGAAADADTDTDTDTDADIDTDTDSDVDNDTDTDMDADTDTDSDTTLQSDASVEETIVIEVSADSFVAEETPNTTYGSSGDLTVTPDWGDGMLPPCRKTYLRFDLGAIPADAAVTAVSLEMMAYKGWAYGGDGHTYTRLVSDDGWDEMTITWANRPTAAAENLGSWWLWYDEIEIEQQAVNDDPSLIPVVQGELDGDGVVSFHLHSTGYETVYRSKEFGDPAKQPVLRVSYLR